MSSEYVAVIIEKDNRLKYYEALDITRIIWNYNDFVKVVIETGNEMFYGYQKVL